MKLHLPVLLRKALLACFSFTFACTCSAAAADLTLGNEDSLTIDYADIASIPDLENGTLQLNGDTLLFLSNCGVGDGKAYTLLTGVSGVLDAEGNALILDSTNNAISYYFDTAKPGTGFWADATLSLSEDGTLQLVRHNETVKAAQTITTLQTASLVFSYYEGISFEDITQSSSSSDYGGAIYGGDSGTIRLSSNGSVTFSGNTAGYGGAIYGYSNSTITLSGNGSVTFSGNTASSSSGGAIYGRTIALRGNGSVTFSGNTASSSGGAIYGGSNSTIELSGNVSVEFSGNTASSGGAIGGGYYSTIELSGNGSVEFSGNRASASSYARGGAICGYGNLNIRNNDSVLFKKNAVVQNETYRLRSIYAGGSGDVISLSAAAGKSIEFRDSVYIASGSTVNLNADYTDANGLLHKQAGDIIFTGNYTEQHLNELLAADGLSRTATAEEILNSRTMEVYAMTNLHGGRLRVEDGAVYMGYGITAMEDSAATVLVKDGILNHAGYELTFNAGTTLELAGENTLYGDVRMLEGSHFSVSIEKPNADYIFGRLQLGGDVSLSISDSLLGENAILLYVSGGIAGWNEDNITLHSNTVGPDDLTWVGNMLVLNHNADTFNRYFNGEYSASEQLIGNVGLVCYTGISFENISGGAIYGSSNSTIVLNGNGSVEFSGNSASSAGGAIDGRTIELNGNGSVTFSGNTASNVGGAIDGRTIELNGNGSVEFSGNSASSDGFGGAIYGSTITLSGNESVMFSGNTASGSGLTAYGGAIYGRTITLSDNGIVSFCENDVSSYHGDGGAICGDGVVTLNNNESVLFSKNTSSFYGGAIEGGTMIELSGNGTVTFSGNAAGTGGAIYGGTIELSGNGNVTFSGNTGSAIYGGYDESMITLSGNRSVEFIGNSAFSDRTEHGGAIYGARDSAISLSGNESVTFSGNTAGTGGAICGGDIYYGSGSTTIELSGNGSVTFSGNTAFDGGAICGGGSGSTIELSGNGSVTFSGNTAGTGGAICGYSNSTIELSGNESVTFSGNGASDSHTYGGAIYGDSNSTITLSNNGSVMFSGNRASGSHAYGGAIYSSGSVTITGNDEVTFARNVEKSHSNYRLRSLYLAGDSSTDKMTLSAGKNQSISFYDSVYMGANGSVALNADYEDADGVVQKASGTILFSGATTEEDLKDAKGGVAGTESEILNSRTSEINSAATLYGGTLQVQDKAVLELNGGLTVAEGSEASVEVKAAELNLVSHALSMVSGSSLALADGAKVSATEVTITTGATLAVRGSVSTAPLTEQVAALTLSEETVAGFDATRAVNTGSVSVLEGDLTLESGSVLSLDDGYLELSGDLFFAVAEGEEKIELDIAPGIITESNNHVVLFNVGGVVTFGFDALTTTVDDGMVYSVKATDYFTGSGMKESTKLVYDGKNGVVYLEDAFVGAVPEPTSSMLGLMGLVAFTLRRRRK